MARSMIKSRISNQETNDSVSEIGAVGALPFPGPDEILNDVILDQMMMDG
jgi:hypothetical protein